MTGIGERSQVMADVLAALPADEFISAHDLWHRMGKWARRTIRAALQELHDTGLASREIGVWRNNPIHRFRKLT